METRKLASLQTNPLNPRHGDDQISGLAESIRRLGILEPLLITQDGVILAGERRFLAAAQIGLEDVPVVVLNGLGSRPLEVMIAENCHRRDLTLSEVGGLLKCMVDDGLSKAKIAEITKLSAQTVRDALLVRGLSLNIRPYVDDGRIAIATARWIERLPEKRKAALATWAADEALPERIRLEIIKRFPRKLEESHRILRGTNLTVGEKDWRTSIKKINGAGAQEETVLSKVIEGLSLAEDALCFFPEFMPYVERLMVIRGELATEVGKERKLDIRMIASETERELQLKRDRSEREGFKAVGTVKYNQETGEFYLRMTKRSK